jgi:hypothetical protein
MPISTQYQRMIYTVHVTFDLEFKKIFAKGYG